VYYVSGAPCTACGGERRVLQVAHPTDVPKYCVTWRVSGGGKGVYCRRGAPCTAWAAPQAGVQSTGGWNSAKVLAWKANGTQYFRASKRQASGGRWWGGGVSDNAV
jgi:hypothetical protein